MTYCFGLFQQIPMTIYQQDGASPIVRVIPNKQVKQRWIGRILFSSALYA